MSIHFPSAVREALSRLHEAGFAACAVGSCVRDALRGKTPRSWDLTVSACPEQIREIFRGCPIFSGASKYSTLTVMIKNQPVQISPCRISLSEHSSNPIREDLSCRDFTINAVGASPETGLTDPFGGKTDLNNRLIRCVGTPEACFQWDALRILRALRLASVLNFSIHAETAAAIHAQREKLRTISPERITAEFLRLLCGKAALRILMEYADVVTVIVPELAPSVGHLQYTKHHLYDVYEHTVRAVAAIPPEPVLRLTMLLHDIGKPARFFLEKSTIGHFKGHASESAEMSVEILRRMRISAADSKRILTLIRYHDTTVSPDRVQFWLSVLGTECFFQLMAVKRADNLAQNLATSDRTAEYDRIEDIAHALLAENPCLTVSDLAVSGQELLDAGLHDREVGRTLQELLYQVVTGGCANEKNALLAMVPRLNLPKLLHFPAHPEFRFRKAEKADLPAVEELYRAVRFQISRIPDNLCISWGPDIYPLADTASQAQERGELYILTDGDMVAGSAILTKGIPAPYADGDWLVRDKVCVIHTFTVHPDCRGGTASRRMFQFCEEEAANLGAEAIHLDVLCFNQPAINLCGQCGCRYAGTVDFGKGPSDLRWFRLYEKPAYSWRNDAPQIQQAGVRGSCPESGGKSSYRPGT